MENSLNPLLVPQNATGNVFGELGKLKGLLYGNYGETWIQGCMCIINCSRF
uniref:Uncharacterized protein n=1 Tax=Manihot esculenta TaxID=3983 RepID=A0A2C9W4Y5_MANES